MAGIERQQKTQESDNIVSFGNISSRMPIVLISATFTVQVSAAYTQ